eukprot:1991257-Prymnesium_polylepis.1
MQDGHASSRCSSSAARRPWPVTMVGMPEMRSVPVARRSPFASTNKLWHPPAATGHHIVVGGQDAVSCSCQIGYSGFDGIFALSVPALPRFGGGASSEAFALPLVRAAGILTTSKTLFAGQQLADSSTL